MSEMTENAAALAAADATAMLLAEPGKMAAAVPCLPFPVVGIGASAGGLQALVRLFENMPANNGMAYVVILHLSPQHQSTADQVLQHVTRMPVVQVADTVQIEPNHVYVIAPNKQLSMMDGSLTVVDMQRPRGQHVAIDGFSARWPRRSGSARWRWSCPAPAATARSASGA